MSKAALRVHTGATYRIQIRGFLDNTWSDRLGGFEITSNEELEYGSTVTTLEGSVLDQASLLGILNTLYELHLPLISVECLAVP